MNLPHLVFLNRDSRLNVIVIFSFTYPTWKVDTWRHKNLKTLRGFFLLLLSDKINKNFKTYFKRIGTVHSHLQLSIYAFYTIFCVRFTCTLTEKLSLIILSSHSKKISSICWICRQIQLSSFAGNITMMDEIYGQTIEKLCLHEQRTK